MAGEKRLNWIGRPAPAAGRAGLVTEELPMCPAFLRNPSLSLGSAALALLAAAAPVRAEEDPLLGRIKMIQCVGCTAGSVDLVIHDPIDVRDFQVRINESDYQKIITPLAGKTVYDKGGCFYWFEAPKAKAEPASAEKPKAKPIAKQAPAADSAGTDSAVPGSVIPAVAPEAQGAPSRCLPFSRVEPKPSAPGNQKD
jgi:hypothetical protein